MSLADLRLRNTQQLLDDISAQTSLPDDTVTLVLVHRPATTQRVFAVRRLPVPASHPADDIGSSSELWTLIRDEVGSLPIPPRREGYSIVVTVIARADFNVCTHVEMTCAMAWRCSNHLTNAFSGDYIVLTEHVWCSLDTEVGGSTPCLDPAA